jgi:hypothetical protein
MGKRQSKTGVKPPDGKTSDNKIISETEHKLADA